VVDSDWVARGDEACDASSISSSGCANKSRPVCCVESDQICRAERFYIGRAPCLNGGRRHKANSSDGVG
jgi:hypothetical protein